MWLARSIVVCFAMAALAAGVNAQVSLDAMNAKLRANGLGVLVADVDFLLTSFTTTDKLPAITTLPAFVRGDPRRSSNSRITLGFEADVAAFRSAVQQQVDVYTTLLPGKCLIVDLEAPILLDVNPVTGKPINPVVGKPPSAQVVDFIVGLGACGDPALVSKTCNPVEGTPPAAEVTFGTRGLDWFTKLLGDKKQAERVLSATFTLVFAGADGKPTDCNRNGQSDTAYVFVLLNTFFKFGDAPKIPGDGGCVFDYQSVTGHEFGHILGGLRTRTCCAGNDVIVGGGDNIARYGADRYDVSMGATSDKCTILTRTGQVASQPAQRAPTAAQLEVICKNWPYGASSAASCA